MPVKHGPKGMRAKLAESRLEPLLELETYIAGFRLADEHRAGTLDRIAKRIRKQLNAARAGRCEFDGCDNEVTMCESHLEGEAARGLERTELDSYLGDVANAVGLQPDAQPEEIIAEALKYYNEHLDRDQ